MHPLLQTFAGIEKKIAFNGEVLHSKVKYYPKTTKFSNLALISFPKRLQKFRRHWYQAVLWLFPV
jgi:hypothetical protein